MKTGNGYVHKRSVRKILRFRNYSKSKDEKMSCREKLMLFVPWRNEELELVNIDPVKKVEERMIIITENSAPFYHKSRMSEEDIFHEVENAQLETEENVNVEVFMDSLADYIVEEDFISGGSNPTKVVEKFRPNKLFSDEEYLKIMRRLNQKQKQFVYHVLNAFKTNRVIYNFLSGGAGVGKSEVVTAIVQSVLRYTTVSMSFKPDGMPVVVGAPTGKAAFEVL